MEVLNSLLGSNFENQSFWTAISFILDAFFEVFSCCFVSSFDVHRHHLT